MFPQFWPVIHSVNMSDDCRSQSHGQEKKQNLRRKPSMKFWLLTPPRN